MTTPGQARTGRGETKLAFPKILSISLDPFVTSSMLQRTKRRRLPQTKGRKPIFSMTWRTFTLTGSTWLFVTRERRRRDPGEAGRNQKRIQKIEEHITALSQIVLRQRFPTKRGKWLLLRIKNVCMRKCWQSSQGKCKYWWRVQSSNTLHLQFA